MCSVSENCDQARDLTSFIIFRNKKVFFVLWCEHTSTKTSWMLLLFILSCVCVCVCFYSVCSPTRSSTGCVLCPTCPSLWYGDTWVQGANQQVCPPLFSPPPQVTPPTLSCCHGPYSIFFCITPQTLEVILKCNRLQLVFAPLKCNYCNCFIKVM